MAARQMMNPFALLSDIANGLKGKNPGEPKPGSTPIGCIEVEFYEGDELVKTMDLAVALDAIANDITWDENSSWADADSAKVRSI